MQVSVGTRWLVCGLGSAAFGCSVYGADLINPTAESDGVGGGATAGTVAAGAGAAGSNVAGSGATAGAGGGGTGGTVDPISARLNSVIDVPPIEVNMTDEGARDWAHWGVDDEGGDVYNHKQGVTSQLLDFVPLNEPWATERTNGDVEFRWSDGTPIPSAVTTQGVFWQGLNQGFELTAPAAFEVRRVRVYVGVRSGAAELRARLSDPNARDPVVERLEGAGSTWTQYEVTLEYGFVAQSSTVELVLELIEADGTDGAVGLNGVTFDAP